jgi:hypothetical protein
MEMSIWEHFDELRERVLIAVITSGVREKTLKFLTPKPG